MHVTLLVPDLLWPRPDQEDAFAVDPGATRPLLDCTPDLASYRSLEAVLAERLPTGSTLAQARWQGEQLAADTTPLVPTGVLLCADPVHFAFHQELLIAADATSFTLDLQESSMLVRALNDALASDGNDSPRFIAGSADRWYVWLDRSPEGLPPPTAEIAGRSVAPSFFAAGPLKQLASEVQMLLHSHPLNATREASGQPPINGVWLWGGEASEPQGDAAEQADLVVGDSPLCRGLARLTGAHWRPADDQVIAEIATGRSGPCGAALLVREDLRGAVSRDELAVWQSGMLAFLRDWLAPLHAAWAAGRLEALTLVSPCRTYGTLIWNWRQRPGWPARLMSHWRARNETLSTLAMRLAKQEAQ